MEEGNRQPAEEEDAGLPDHVVADMKNNPKKWVLPKVNKRGRLAFSKKKKPSEYSLPRGAVFGTMMWDDPEEVPSDGQSTSDEECPFHGPCRRIYQKKVKRLKADTWKVRHRLKKKWRKKMEAKDRAKNMARFGRLKASTIAAKAKANMKRAARAQKQIHHKKIK